MSLLCLGRRVVLWLLLVVPAAAADPLDWPSWRGPEQNGVSRETGLVVEWNPDGGQGSNLLWKNDELGGISTPIVMRGKLYTIVRAEPGTPREGEKMICVDAASGKKLWENRFNVFLSDVPKERVGWSNCVGDPATGRVYALGVCGYFQCIDGETGKTIWSHSLSEEFGLLSTYGGRTNVPVVFDDLAIISGVVIGWGDMARPAHRFLAFDKRTGELRWFNGTKPLPEDTTYGTPVLTAFNGQAAMVFGSSDGAIWAFQPRTGKPIWNCQLSRRGLNVSPVVADGVVYAAQAEENLDNTTMGCAVAIDGAGSGDITKTGTLWRSTGIMDGKSSPLLVGGRMYALDDGGKIFILDAKTGSEVSKAAKMVGTIVRGSPVYADGRIYACTTSAYHVFDVTPAGVKLAFKMRLAPEDEVSGSPIISHGRLYIPTAARMYCLADPNKISGVTEQPPAPQENRLDPSDKPAQAQLVPAESLVRPGDTRQFVVRLFNARGQFLRAAPAKFSLEGPGEIDAAGTFTAPSAPHHAAVIVKANVDGLTTQARVRVVPPLPWKFDFSDGEVPITWVGARHRHINREVDGNKLMVKITTIPKGTRSQCWMGHPEFHDYTIQADVRGALTNNKLPDMGVIAQRYTLDLMGASQKLQIRSWTPELERFSKTVPFAWQADTWYTIKFRAAVDDGQAVLKGKVWPRGDTEPEAWTIEAMDEAPNINGSPGLFGNANDSEIFIDNVLVSSNKSG